MTRGRDVRASLQDVPRQVWIGLAFALVVFALAMIVVAIEGVRAKAALDTAAGHAQTLQAQLTGADPSVVTKTLAELRTSTERARTRTDGPHWAAASHLPFVGDDVESVQIAAVSIDRIADTAAPPVVEIGASLNAKTFSPHDGRIDIDGLTKIAPAVADASTVLDTERARIDAINADRLFGPVARPVRELQEKVGSAQSSARAAAIATRMAPGLLGDDSLRRYLLVFQNNAEIRSTGGLNGAYVVLSANDGTLTIEEPGPNADLLGGIEKPVLPLTEDEVLLFPTAMGTDFRNTGFTPDFPRSAALSRAMAKRKLGTTVSGVLSMDPVALSYLLRGTGPITLDDGTVLTPDNAVRILLNEVYARFPEGDAQDDFFAAATKRIFEQAMSGTENPTELMKALAQGVSERRVMFWLADKAEQAQIAGSALANELPGESDVPQYGTYLVDATQSKMQYYLTYKTDVRSTECSADGVQTLVSTTTLRSTAPANAANLPSYITGGGGKVPDGDQSVIVRIYGSSGGVFTELTLDGKEQQVYGLQHHGRPVTYALVKLKPGQSARIVATSVTGRRQAGDGVLLTTPGLTAFRNAAPIPSACH